MPDQSSAADEHAIMQEITAPLTSLPDDPVSIAADVDFPVVLRGYDRLAVDAYVKRTSQLVAELQATRSPEAAIRRALERVGEEVSGILKRAHETAGQITAQSRTDAEDRLDAVRKEAASITAEAESRLKHLDAETDRIWAERHRIVEDTRELARQMLALADTASERFPAAEDTGGGELVTGAAEPEPSAAEVPLAGEGPEDEAVGEAQAAVNREVSAELVDDEGADAAGREVRDAGYEQAGDAGGEAGDPDATLVMPPLPPPEEPDHPRQ